MAGRLIEESKAQRWKDMEAAKGKASMSTNGGGTGNQVLVAHMDLNSKAFISYVDPSALYSSLDATAYTNLTSINTDEVVLFMEVLEHHAFAIMHNVNVASTYLHGNFPGDDAPAGSPSTDDLLAWMIINSDITSSLDWNAHSRPVDLAAVSTSAPNQASCTVVSSEEFPFYLDSGTTTHLSPSHFLCTPLLPTL